MTTQVVKRRKVACFVDGFNLYHSIDNAGKHHLKWVNLDSLMRCFIDPTVHDLTHIHYFSAVAEWLPEPAKRHKAYIASLQSVGVNVVLGAFKKKDRTCKSCGKRYTTHEEKQTDVNIAVELARRALIGEYDEAFLLTRDSDLVPAVKLVCDLKKRVKIIAPLGLHHSKELGQVASARASIKEIHLERALFPQSVLGPDGTVVATRPAKYDPP